MTDVDAILASGRYVDRRDLVWERGLVDWWHVPSDRTLTPAQMRTLIERDQHRSECPGLRYCDDHPVSHVLAYGVRAIAFPPHGASGYSRNALANAIDAARHMTGATP